MDFTINWCKRPFLPAEIFIYGHINVNISPNQGDMKKLCLDKIVGIILELPNENNALPSHAGILRKIFLAYMPQHSFA